jgi:hypothetical protein
MWVIYYDQRDRITLVLANVKALVVDLFVNTLHPFAHFIMPLHILGEIYYNGIQAVPFLPLGLKFIPWLVLVIILRFYFDGAQNNQERVMHSKVVLVTVRFSLFLILFLSLCVCAY